MYKNMYFDYSACIILALLILSTIFRRMLKGKANKYFFALLIIAFLSAVFDTLSVSLDNYYPESLIIRHFAHSAYLITHCITLPFYVLYLVVLTDTWHLIKKNIIIPVVSVIPVMIVLALIATNAWTGNIFYFAEDLSYARGRYMISLYICAAIYAIYGMFYLIYFRKQLRRKNLISVLCVVPAVTITVLIQFLKPYIILEMFGLAVALLFISLMVQRPEEVLDVVTGLYKLTAYMRDMSRTMTNLKNVRIIMINISNFTSIRDIVGYNNSLIILKKLADRICELEKKYRLDGDIYYLERGKFRIVVDERHFDSVRSISEDINTLMKESIIINQMSVNMVAQICITDCPQDIRDVDALMSFGDLLNTIPYTGNIVFATELLSKVHYDIMQDIDAIIEDALANKKFEVYYQPIYSVRDKRFLSAEALLRLKDERYGFISPEIFIPAAERSGAIHKIGDFVLEEVCGFISDDEFEKLCIDYIEVNLSVAQCMQSNLVENVLNMLKKYDISPDKINLEITETAASVSQQTLTDNIEALTSAGIKFSLDDFGTGYSNMQRVASLPLDIVKLDKSFTEVGKNPRFAIVLKNTIRMIKDMNMKIVVEGIETEDMVKSFSELQCEYIQGYYFSKPVPRDEFVKFIKKAGEA